MAPRIHIHFQNPRKTREVSYVELQGRSEKTLVFSLNYQDL